MEKIKLLLSVLIFVVAVFLYLKKTRVNVDLGALQNSYQNNKNILGIDVRSAFESKINPGEGSLNIPLNELLSSKKLPENKKTEIWLFCESGARSSSAQALLISKGYTNTKNIGSWRSWNQIRTN